MTRVLCHDSLRAVCRNIKMMTGNRVVNDLDEFLIVFSSIIDDAQTAIVWIAPPSGRRREDEPFLNRTRGDENIH